MARVRRPLLIGLAAVLAVTALAAVVGWRLLAAHHAPPPLALSSTPASASGSPLDGKWTVGAGSQAGYRVKEKFINQPAETEAVARTSSVTGSLLLSVSGDQVRVSQMRFAVDLASLTSQDKYANYQTYQRDFFIRRIYLETAQFPTATFTASTFTFTLPADGRLTTAVSGKLNVHGVTRDVTAQIQAADGGAEAEVAGSIVVDMRDYAIDPPDISFTRAEPMVTIEFDLKLLHQ